MDKYSRDAAFSNYHINRDIPIVASCVELSGTGQICYNLVVCDSVLVTVIPFFPHTSSE
jgi:hypothetical protein